MNRIRTVLLSMPLLVGAAFAQAQQSSPRLSGDVVALNGSTLQVKSSAGQTESVTLGSKLRVIAISPSNLSAIKQNDYVATTSVPQPDGTLNAVEIRIFPESMRGTGEGHRPMDNKPGDTMTNATVTNIGNAPKAGDTTTNATVASVTNANKSMKMTVKYKGGEKEVLISDKTPIYRMEDGDRSLLVPGAHVVLNTTKQGDGTMISERLTVGKNGIVPPQ